MSIFPYFHHWKCNTNTASWLTKWWFGKGLDRNVLLAVENIAMMLLQCFKLMLWESRNCKNSSFKQMVISNINWERILQVRRATHYSCCKCYNILLYCRGQHDQPGDTRHNPHMDNSVLAWSQACHVFCLGDALVQFCIKMSILAIKHIGHWSKGTSDISFYWFIISIF